MTPIAKELETLPEATSPSVSTNAVIKKPQETAARPQPVPLEVAVTVNGARTIEGSDKREPFSESTKTVLVFANGAVIRLTSTVAPGQLLFVTNEKSKKEVVCQVVKSRNDGKSTGYVELEFTEPAIGFWGVRIPAETASLPPSALPKAPVVARPVLSSVGSPSAAVPPTVSVAVPPTPQNVVPNVVLKAASPVVPPVATPIAVKPVTPAALAAKPVVVAASIDAAAIPKPEMVAKPPISPLPPVPSQLVTKPSELFEVPARAAAPANEISSQDLKQQAARLQEQLNALLFREAAAEKAALTSPVVAPSLAVEETTAPSDAARQILELAETAVKPNATAKVPKIVTLPPVPVEAKQPAIIPKSSSISLPVEEVKIPSWLAPLARETHETAAETESSEVSTTSSANVHDTDLEALPLADLEATSQKSETVVFGGQLLGGDSTTAVSSSGSKKGLFLGLAAAAVLLIGGGAWYGKQPGNFLNTTASPSPVIENSQAQVNGSAARTDSNAPAAGANSTLAPSLMAPANQAVTVKPPNVPPANTSPAPSTVVAARTENSAARNAPPVPEPKKPALGEVRLATPNVNRSATSDAAEGAPSIDSAQGTSDADPMVGIASPSSGPSAPIPIGGDVKPAHLLKSTPPIYPATAKSQRVSGDVKIDALIDASGVVTSTKVLSGPTMLHQAAVTAVKQWKYEAAQLDGKPTPMHLTVTVQFRLQ